MGKCSPERSRRPIPIILGALERYFLSAFVFGIFFLLNTIRIFGKHWILPMPYFINAWLQVIWFYCSDNKHGTKYPDCPGSAEMMNVHPTKLIGHQRVQLIETAKTVKMAHVHRSQQLHAREYESMKHSHQLGGGLSFIFMWFPWMSRLFCLFAAWLLRSFGFAIVVPFWHVNLLLCKLYSSAQSLEPSRAQSMSF